MARDGIFRDCVHAYATYFWFMDRARRIKRRMQAISVLGILQPLIIGAAYMRWGASTDFLIPIASVLSFILLILSCFSLGYKWDDRLAIALESSAENRVFADGLRRAYESSFITDQEAEAKADAIRSDAESRNEKDDKEIVSEWERRFGHRWALRELQRQCVHCSKIPYDMSPSKCVVCGKFPNSFMRLFR